LGDKKGKNKKAKVKNFCKLKIPKFFYFFFAIFLLFEF